MTIASDFSVNGSGDIRYTGSGDNYSVLELHRWLQNLADDPTATGDDLIDITSETPSERFTDNYIQLNAPYNVDDTAVQHVYDGSIVQAGGDTIYDGIVNYGVQGIYIQIIQNGALISPNFWTTGINADSSQGISSRFMIKVRDSGADIDSRILIGTAREFGNTYSEFKINGTNRGNNTLALTQSDDLNNATVEGTVSGWTGITNTEGYRAIDVNNDSVDEYYYSEWDRSTYAINQFYERMKWLTRRGSSSTLYGIDGNIFRGITHEIDTDTPSGTFDSVESLSWSGGTGQLLAINSVTNPTKIWIQLLTGIAPTDGQIITGGNSSATCEVNTTVTERPISSPFVGASTGSAIIGSYGFGIEALDLTKNDKVFDLTNTQRSSPDYETFIVSGLIAGEDRIIVGQKDTGDDIKKDQFTLQTTLNGATETAVVVPTAIPSDTPATGTIRVQIDTGIYLRVEYTSWTGSIFTIASSDWSGSGSATSGNNLFISYADELASGATVGYTAIYSSDRTLFVRVRDGGSTPIKTFESPAVFNASGGGVTAIRTSDI